MFRAHVADPRYDDRQFGLCLLGRFDQWQTNLWRHQVQQAQSIFEWDRVRLQKQGRRERRELGRQPLGSHQLPLAAKPERMSEPKTTPSFGMFAYKLACGLAAVPTPVLQKKLNKVVQCRADLPAKERRFLAVNRSGANSV
jgi:hypothetical protein